MIAKNAETCPQRSRELRCATEAALMQEIAFIPNDEFASLNLPCSQDPRDYLVETPEVESRPTKMAPHLERICNTPLLSAADERELFRAMNYFKYRANVVRAQLDADQPDEEKLTHFQDFVSAASELRNYIVQANTRLVMSIVKSFSDSETGFDDLLSEGIHCLMNSVEKFNYARGFRFSTYATSAVRRDLVRLVNRRHRDKTRFASGTGELISQRGTEPEPSNRTESNLLAIDDAVNSVVARLDDREQMIIRARYGFDDFGAKPTFQRIGQSLGISKERVRQLELRALSKLRDLIAPYHLEPLDTY